MSTAQPTTRGDVPAEGRCAVTPGMGAASISLAAPDIHGSTIIDTQVTPCEAGTGAEEALSVEVEGSDSYGITVCSFVVPLWRKLRSVPYEPSEVFLRLERPTTEKAPLVLHLRVPSHRRQDVKTLLRDVALEAGGVILQPRRTDDTALLGEWPLGGEEVIVARYRACLELSTDVYLAAVSANGCTELPYAERESAVLELLLAGLPAMLPKESQWQDYLAFHRDWLVRYPVLQNGYGTSKASQILDLLDAQMEKVGQRDFRTLAGATPCFVAGPLRAAWSRSLSELATALAGRESDPRYQLDPFAHGPLFPTHFRLLHAVARQFGIALLDEAFLHHLVLKTLGSDAGRDRFCLAPHLHRLRGLADESPGRLVSSFQEGYPWRELVGLAGDAGREWLLAYKESDDRVGRALQNALSFLRNGRSAESYELLAQVEKHRQQVRLEHPGVFHVLGRFYHGVVAYYEYQTGNLTAADREMEYAAAAVRQSLEAHRFLLPFAPLITDIPLQKARIARRERDWRAMERHIDTMYEMETGSRPLCVLANGTVVDYSLLDGYFRSLDLGEDQRSAVEKLMRLQTRLGEFLRLTLRLYALPDLVNLNSPVSG